MGNFDVNSGLSYLIPFAAARRGCVLVAYNWRYAMLTLPPLATPAMQKDRNSAAGPGFAMRVPFEFRSPWLPPPIGSSTPAAALCRPPTWEGRRR